ncbi:hypothetical protein NMT12_180053 [metagenome]
MRNIICGYYMIIDRVKNTICVLSICNMIMKHSVFLIRKSNYSYYESATSTKKTLGFD